MPSDEDVGRWLRDIAVHIGKAETFVAGVSADEFKTDELRLYAVTRCLEIISEASRRLPDTLKGRHASIPWQRMAAAGNVYRHEYEDVAASLIWIVLQDHLPALAKAVEQELATLGESKG